VSALLFLALTAAAGPVDPLAKCDVLGPENGAERTLSCPKGSAFVTVDGPTVGTEPLIVLMKEALSEDKKPKWIDGEITLGGSKRRALRYTVAGKKGVIVVMPLGEERVRGFGCESTDEVWCSALLEKLVSALPEPNMENPAAEQARLLAGRKIEIPAGCTEKAPGLITCPKHSFSFANQPKDDLTDIDMMAKSLRGGLSEMGEVGETNRACTIEGVKSTCRVLTIKRSDGKQLYVIAAFTEVKKQKVYIQCNSSEGIGVIPPACRSTLVLD